MQGLRAPNEILFQVDFGLNGNGSRYTTGSWSHPEEGWTWALWPNAGLRLPKPRDTRPLAILMEITPAIQPPTIQSRRFSVILNGEATTLDVGVFRSDAFLIFVPEIGQHGLEWIDLDFESPGRIDIPGDSRLLTFAFRRVTILGVSKALEAPPRRPAVELVPMQRDFRCLTSLTVAAVRMPIQDLLMTFESLGNICDFGDLQRRVGAEPIGLLRFAGIDIRDLVCGLFERFVNLENGKASLTVIPGPPQEYFLRNEAYGIGYHTRIGPDAASPEQVIARETWRMPFLKRHFLEIVDGALKVFVLFRLEGLHRAQVEAVAAALRLTGDNVVLWAAQDGNTPVGCVEQLSTYLFRGQLDSTSIRGLPSHEAWLCVCANARLIIANQRISL